MRACIKVEQGRVEVRDVPSPEPGPGEVVVKTTLTTLCGSDLHFVDDMTDDLLNMVFPGCVEEFGVPMGHESVGVVHAVGEGVSRLKEGDRVVAGSLTACGACDDCLRGDQSICTGGGRLLFGCQAEYFRVPFADISVARIPDAVTDEQAILPSDIMSVAFAAVERAEAEFGSSVAVFAQGPVGLCATAAARARGCGLIIAVDTVPARLDMARKLGANVTLNPREVDPVAEIMEITGGTGVDTAIEAVGLEPTFEGCANAVRKGGTISSVGVYSSLHVLPLNPHAPSFLHRKLITTLAPTGRHRLEQLLRVVEHGGIDLSGLFTHRMSLDEAPKAYDMFRERADGVLKVALQIK